MNNLPPFDEIWQKLVQRFANIWSALANFINICKHFDETIANNCKDLEFGAVQKCTNILLSTS